MTATAILSFIVSNTATTLIMIPIAVAVLHAAGIGEGETDGFPGALAMGIAFAASIGGLGTLVGSPPTAIAAGILQRSPGPHHHFPPCTPTTPRSWKGVACRGCSWGAPI